MASALTESASKMAATGTAIRVMVVDDSAVIRGIFRRTLDADPQITVVASVANGQYALDSLARQQVDIVVLDIEMPVMDGMTALPKILAAQPDVKVIMASTLTQKNADISLKALQNGASDYIPKPTAKHEIHSAESFKRELVEKVRALGSARLATARAPLANRPPGATPQPSGPGPIPGVEGGIRLRAPSKVKPKVLCIGSSTGGPKALIDVLGGGLGGNFALPIIITQHMPKTFTAILAEHIGQASGMPTTEGESGMPLKAGHIYVAPGGSHMLVGGSVTSPIIRIDDGPAENFCKPAVDPMLRSTVALFGDRVLTVILTGMGQDGLAGGRVVVDAGGTVIAQDEATSVVWGMPGAVANAGICSAVVPLPEMVDQIRKIAGKSAA